MEGAGPPSKTLGARKCWRPTTQAFWTDSLASWRRLWWTAGSNCLWPSNPAPDSNSSSSKVLKFVCSPTSTFILLSQALCYSQIQEIASGSSSSAPSSSTQCRSSSGIDWSWFELFWCLGWGCRLGGVVCRNPLQRFLSASASQLSTVRSLLE